MANKKGSKVRRYMESLMRLLRKPKDLYVEAITTCSSHFPYVIDTTMGFPTPTLPRTSFTAAAGSSLLPGRTSSRHGNTSFEFDHHLDCSRKPPRIGRIDEDKPCEFGYDMDDDDINVKHLICPRSRSHAYAVQARPRKGLF